MILLLQYMYLHVTLAAPYTDINNYLLCHSTGKYLSYIPIHDLLLPLGEYCSECKLILFYLHKPFFTIANVIVLELTNPTTSGNVCIVENNSGDTKVLSIDSSMNLVMVSALN